MDHPMFSGDSSDPLFSGITLHSLLTLNPSFLAADNFPFPFPDEPLQPLTTHNHLSENTNNKNLLIPKSEYPHHHQIPIEQQLQLLTSHLNPQPTFHRLPQLSSPDRKRLRHDQTVLTTPPPPPPQSNLARQRRQKLSEKTRCLQKLMPWDKKMDQGTLLEEAYKYVKFLQAQSSVLQSMPTTHYSAGSPTGAGAGEVFGELEKLNRSQVLQVLVNSPVAQTMLYSQGLCVFSKEQVALLTKFSERKHHQYQYQYQYQQQQQMSDHSSSKTFFN